MRASAAFTPPEAALEEQPVLKILTTRLRHVSSTYRFLSCLG
jgi:hypothetical protein